MIGNESKGLLSGVSTRTKKRDWGCEHQFASFGHEIAMNSIIFILGLTLTLSQKSGAFSYRGDRHEEAL